MTLIPVPLFRIPSDDTLSYGTIKQNEKCVDTLNHNEGQTVGFFDCHGQGGNQVNFQCISVVLVCLYLALAATCLKRSKIFRTL